MKKKYIIILSIFCFTIIFFLLNYKTKLYTGNINPVIKEKIIVSQYDFLNNKEVGTYYVDIESEKAFIYTGSYNTGAIIDKIKTKENSIILQDKKYGLNGTIYSYKTIDKKYLITVNNSQFYKFGIRFSTGAGSIYIIDLENGDFKQIFIKELNDNNKYLYKIKGIGNL